MPEFNVNQEKLHVFKISGKYVFKKYFDKKEIFSKLSDIYNNQKYRFEYTEQEKQKTTNILNEYYYEPKIHTDLQPYIVGKERYTKHASILKNSVSQRMIEDYNLFLMKDPFSVEKALQENAEPIEKLDINRKPEEITNPEKWK